MVALPLKENPPSNEGAAAAAAVASHRTSDGEAASTPHAAEEPDGGGPQAHQPHRNTVTPIDPTLFREVQIRRQRLQALVSRTEQRDRRHSLLKSVSTTW